MYCRHCGKRLAEHADFCLQCGAIASMEKIVLVQPVKPPYYTAGFVLGILSICLFGWGTILGLIGLPLACISKRRSAIVLNIIGLTLQLLIWLFLILSVTHMTFPYFPMGQLLRLY